MKSRFLILPAFLSGVFVLGSMAHAALPTFSYRIETPVVVGDTQTHGSCANKAVDIGNQFAASGVQVVSSVCKGTRSVTEGAGASNLGTIIITYMANHPVDPYAAIYSAREFQGTASTTVGVTASIAECSAIAEQQIAAFESETQLKVLAVECVKSQFGEDTYSVRISALGKPAKRLYMFDSVTQMIDSTPRPEIQAAAQNILKVSGADIELVSGSFTYYYNTRPISMDRTEFGQFQTLAQCQAQQADALSILTQARLVAPQVFCTGGVDAITPAMDSIGGDVIIVDSDLGYGSATYSTFDDCFSDRARLIANGQATGRKIYGVICHLRPGSRSDFIAETYKPGL